MAEPFPPLVGVLNEPVGSAAPIAADADDDRTREEVVDLLRRAADEDDRVRPEPVEAWQGNLSLEADRVGSRIEKAGDDLAAARADVPDEAASVPLVQHRLATFEERHADVAAAHADVEADLERVAATYDQRPGLYGALARLDDLDRELDDLSSRAGRLVAEIKEFGSWVEEPAVRYGHLEEDLDLIDHYLDEIESALEHLESGGRDQVGQWVRASLLVRASRFLHSDVAGDLADLREWADHERADDVADRLDEQDARLERYEERIPPLEPDTLADGVHGILDDLDDTLASFERPVDWDAVEEALSSARSDLGALREPAVDPSLTE